MERKKGARACLSQEQPCSFDNNKFTKHKVVSSAGPLVFVSTKNKRHQQNLQEIQDPWSLLAPAW